MFSNALYRLSLLALFLNADSTPVSARWIGSGEVDAILTSSTTVHHGAAPMKFLRTPVTKRSNNNHTWKKRVPRTLPVLDALLPLSANVKVDICIDLSVRVLGIVSLNVFVVANLQASIDQNGISAQELTTLQAYLNAQLAASARAASTSWECQQGCTTACSSQSWDQSTKTCSLVPQQLTTKSSVLANLIAQLGPSDAEYCQLCPNRCNAAPSAAPRLFKRASAVGICPIGLNACPINASSLSLGFECLNVQQELDSCGGCASTGEGVNCNTLPGFKLAGCNAGQCVAFECEENYRLTATKACVLIVA